MNNISANISINPMQTQSSEMVSAPPIKEEENDKVSQKLIQIKVLASVETKLHDRIHTFHLKDKLTFEKAGKNIIDFHLDTLDSFIHELVDKGSCRKVQFKKIETSTFKIQKQICNIQLKGKNVTAEVLVDSKETVIKPCKGFLKVQIEKSEIDNYDPFVIPLGHIVDEGSEDILDSTCKVVATVPTDIHLAPKSFHTQLCNVSSKEKDLNELASKVVVLNRTKDHGMNIGMRKMILIPRAVTELQMDGDTAKVMVTIYNASRQNLRISTKTNIATLFVSKEQEFNVETRGMSTNSVSIDAYEVGRLPVRLDDVVRENSTVMVAEQEVDGGMKVMPGLLKVRSREGRQYVDVAVSNDTNTARSIRLGTRINAFNGVKD